jgi:predicted AAA+ superfamily ATPase
MNPFNPTKAPKIERAQKQALLKDLRHKMVLLTGPRQAGKTWLAKDIAKHYTASLYLNYDITQDREIIESQSWLDDTQLLILDEIHKMPNWKNYLKGLVDANDRRMHILVTGSVRLDIYDRLGDSLAGRYFRHRLLPISPAEIANQQTQSSSQIGLEDFINRSGFPEPLLMADIIDVKRWRQQYIQSMMSTDIFEIDTIHNLKAMGLVFHLLRQKVGSPVSYRSIAEDVQISPTTVKKYIQILESLYIIFQLSPYSNNIARSLIKEPKIYFFDPGLINTNEGYILENLVALYLLKDCYGRVDCLGDNMRLHYLRTKDGEEVDFAIVKNDEIDTLIEVKLSKAELSKTLVKFHLKYSIPSVQLVKNLAKPRTKDNIIIKNVEDYLKHLYL